MKKLYILIILIVPLVMSGVVNAKSVGIWYETLYSKEKNYNWATGFGYGTQTKLVGDVTGDGKDDAVAIGGNDWYVSVSDGMKYQNYSQWRSNFSGKAFLGDVNGDGKADAVTFSNSKGGNLGVWEVSLSNGASFGSPTTWIVGWGYNTQNQLLADTTGDGKADATAYIDTGSTYGDWYVAPSNGSSFAGGSRWIAGMGHGSQKQFLSDVTGDGKADIVVYFDIAGARGNWYISTSSGSLFNNYSLWKSNWGVGSNVQMLGDTNGDSKADAIIYWNWMDVGRGGEQGAMYKAESSGTSFVGTTSQVFHTGHGNNISHNKVGPASNMFMADVDGDGSDESIAYHELYTNGAPAGQWKVLFNQYVQPDQQNYWDTLNVEHIPVGGQYDSGDTTRIEQNLTQIDNAGIDFIIIDLTNGVSSHQWILDRARAVCGQLAAHNNNGGSLKFAIAIGKAGYTGNTADVEAEAQEVLDGFVNDTTCGPSYYKVNDKPLLESHFNSYAQKQDWLNGPHTVTGSFIVKYGLGRVPDAPSNVPASTGNGCGSMPGSTPPMSDLPNYIGWTLPYGTMAFGPYATVSPGTNNKSGNVLKRTQNDVEGAFYTTCGWDRIQANKFVIDTVIIVSYNDYAEETVVSPTDTSHFTNVPPLSETWSSPDLYWDKTVEQINLFKN